MENIDIGVLQHEGETMQLDSSDHRRIESELWSHPMDYPADYYLNTTQRGPSISVSFGSEQIKNDYLRIASKLGITLAGSKN